MEAVKDYREFIDRVITGNLNRTVKQRLVKAGPCCPTKPSPTTHKIHMGSGNILMEPDDRYLCIASESKKFGKSR
jgi:hypothetical protein